MKKLRPAACFAVVFCLALSCGGDDDSSIDATIADFDAAVTDASGSGDASSQAECQALCSCAVANCPNDFEMTSCMTECAGLRSSVRACRTLHCGYAQSDPTTHCPHVEGDPTSGLGTPTECIQ
jgi:hypothetical protein